jgi:hypothetical protein
MRAVAELDAIAMVTDLGQTLVTTPEQTVLDLARVDPRAEDLDAQEAIDALWSECDPARLEEIAGRQRMRATLEFSILFVVVVATKKVIVRRVGVPRGSLCMVQSSAVVVRWLSPRPRRRARR